MKLAEISRKPCAVIMGESGSGKTHLIGTLCETVPTLVITSDPNGLDTLDKMGVDPDVLLIEDWEKAWEYFGQIVKAQSNGIKAIALDDLGSTQYILRRTILARARTADEKKQDSTKREEESRKSVVMGRRMMELQGFGIMTTSLEAFLHEILLLAFPLTLVTVLEDQREHPRTGLEHLYPDLQGGLRYGILARFSLVANAFRHAVNGKTQWCLTTYPHPRIPTKDRYGEPRTWLNPTAGRLMRHMLRVEGDLEKETVTEAHIGVGIEDRRSK